MVLVESGDRVPADVRWIETNSCSVEESALTGESMPVNKHSAAILEEEVPLGDQKNIGFMGTMVTRGRPEVSSSGPAWRRRWAKSLT